MAGVRAAEGCLLCRVERKIVGIVDHVRHGDGTCVGVISREVWRERFARSQGGDSAYLPATHHGVCYRVHACAVSLALAKRQFIGVADDKAMTIVWVNVASLGAYIMSILSVTRNETLESADVMRPCVRSEKGKSTGETLFQFGLQGMISDRKVGIVDWSDDCEVGQNAEVGASHVAGWIGKVGIQRLGWLVEVAGLIVSDARGTGPNVSNMHHPVLREFALDCQVPLQNAWRLAHWARRFYLAGWVGRIAGGNLRGEPGS